MQPMALFSFTPVPELNRLVELNQTDRRRHFHLWMRNITSSYSSSASVSASTSTNWHPLGRSVVSPAHCNCDSTAARWAFSWCRSVTLLSLEPRVGMTEVPELNGIVALNGIEVNGDIECTCPVPWDAWCRVGVEWVTVQP